MYSRKTVFPPRSRNRIECTRDRLSDGCGCGEDGIRNRGDIKEGKIGLYKKLYSYITAIIET